MPNYLNKYNVFLAIFKSAHNTCINVLKIELKLKILKCDKN